jgi:16S rRNA U1498 N3-methylase RsmE
LVRCGVVWCGVVSGRSFALVLVSVHDELRSRSHLILAYLSSRNRHGENVLELAVRLGHHSIAVMLGRNAVALWSAKTLERCQWIAKRQNDSHMLTLMQELTTAVPVNE